MGTCHYLGESLGPMVGGFIVKYEGFDVGTGVFGLSILGYMTIFSLVVGGCGILFTCQSC